MTFYIEDKGNSQDGFKVCDHRETITSKEVATCKQFSHAQILCDALNEKRSEQLKRDKKERAQ